MRSIRRLRALGWLLPFWSASAAAAPPDRAGAEEPIRLEYRSPPGCPSEEAVESSLRASTPRFRFAADGERARVFVIEAAAAHSEATGPGKYQGRLTITDLSGQSAVREVTGDSCAEAVAAITFVAALAIDPNAVPAPGSAPSTTAAPSATAPEPAPNSGAAQPPANPPVVPATAQIPASPDNAIPVEQSRPSRTQPRFSAALRGGLVTGVAPEAVGIGRLAAELSFVTEGSVFSPSFALSAARGATQSVPTETATAELTWTVGRIDACVLRFPARIDTRWELRLGPFFEAGLLAGSAPTLPSQTPKDRGWAAVGALTRFALTIAGPVSLEAEVGLAAPIKRYHFYFSPGADVFQVPPVSFSADAGIAVRFW